MAQLMIEYQKTSDGICQRALENMGLSIFLIKKSTIHLMLVQKEYLKSTLH
jgi:hypothetical protein